MPKPKVSERDPDIVNKHFPVVTKFGRPAKYRMQNGAVTRDDIFLYTPEETIPADQLDRFLEQCDNMIIMLDPRKINKSEVEEIAKVYREGVVIDSVYKTLAEDGATLDAAIMTSLEKLLKAVERRKENLAIRASDRNEGREFNKEFTMVDLLAKVSKEVDLLEREEMELSMQLSSAKQTLSKAEDFVEDKNSEPDDGYINKS